jgi:hypothetical protein
LTIRSGSGRSWKYTINNIVKHSGGVIMRPTYFFILLSVCVLLSGCTAGSSHARSDYDFSSIDRVAVIDVEGDVAGEVAKNQLADYFVMELLKKGYAPIERARVQALLKEQKFQASDITIKEGMARAGRILNVKTVLLINVPKFGDQINMTARMVDLEDGSILWLGSGSGKSGELLYTLGGAAAGAAAGATVTDDSQIGAIAGGVLGGVAGQALSPQTAAKAREIVQRMCKDLPYQNPLIAPKGLFK